MNVDKKMIQDRVTWCAGRLARSMKKAKLIIDGRPRNPCGRTGMTGRGLGGRRRRWGGVGVGHAGAVGCRRGGDRPWTVFQKLAAQGLHVDYRGLGQAMPPTRA